MYMYSVHACCMHHTHSSGFLEACMKDGMMTPTLGVYVMCILKDA